MEELKIWKVDGNDSPEVSELETTDETKTEEQLEGILTKNPDMLENGLDLVGRQVNTKSGPLDLLGVDSEGRLVVFELKRGRLNRDAVAQVIDYASQLNAMNLNSLYQHIAERSGKLGIQKIDDFEVWYNDNYRDPEHDLDSLMPPRIVLVGLGVDETTERMVNYLAALGLDVSLLTFHGFKQGSDTLLARHVEVDAPVQATPSRKRNQKQQFTELAQTWDAQPLVEAVTTMFVNQRRSRPKFTMSYAIMRKQFKLNYSWYQGGWSPTSAATLFVELVGQGAVNIGFHPAAVALATRAEFDKLKAEGLEFKESKSERRAFFRIGSIDYELILPVRSLKEWEAREKQLAALVQKVCEGYDALRQETLAEKTPGGGE